MYLCGRCGKWVLDGGICWSCVNKAAAEKLEEAHREIDRAMEWCVEYLRWCEVEAYKEDFPMSMDDYARLADDTIDTCIRYLEKIEQELEANNE